MSVWTCINCGGNVHGYEGEKGRLVGTCPVCGRGYGGATSVEPPEPYVEESKDDPKYHSMRYALLIGEKDKASWVVYDKYLSVSDAENDAKFWAKKGQPWRIETRPYGCYAAFVRKENLPEVVKEGVGA